MNKGIDVDVIVAEVRETSHKPDEVGREIISNSPKMVVFKEKWAASGGTGICVLGPTELPRQLSWLC